ncbi:MAG: ATP-binding protein [Bacteroidales bacterium]|nr:ATP-binding protein [Bacteroidales bacterium]
MIFKRIIEKNLEVWKNNPDRKPLIIRGARQVGKTTLIKEFAKSYKYSVMLNLEKTTDASFFNNNMDAKSILESLFLAQNISIASAGETLLFLDEIQESPAAIQMLRYFYEDFPDLNVIAAGSLLEFAMRKVKSFPVGRVEYLYLHPLNFIEYLKAIDHQAALQQIEKIPVEPFAHSVLLDIFNRYAIIGGMPEVIANFIQKDSLTELPQVYESIWDTYRNDVEKYAANETDRRIIKHIISTAHLYIDQRIKFQGFGQSNYRSREVGEAFRNLDDAKVIRLIYPTTDIEVPVKPDLRKSPRLQFLDTGLLNNELEIQAEMLILKDLSKYYKKAIIPHLVMQEVISLNTLSDKKPHFWVREKKQSSSEVDMAFPYKDIVIPIEIKSGSDGALKSLHQFVERCNHHFAVRIYAGKFEIVETKTPGGKPYLLMNMPYYLGTKISEYLAYFTENYRTAIKP